MDECRRSGQIPAFGNWDYANELPITQYFESARQAGLIRYCSSTGECDATNNKSGDLYDAVDFNNRTTVVVSSRKKRGSKSSKRNYGRAQVKEESNNKKMVNFKVENVDVHKVNTRRSHQQQQQQQQKHNDKDEIIMKKKINNNNYSSSRQLNTTTSFKPVDEDLYKIPPHLLHTSKRKKMLGFLSRCLAPGCSV